GARRRQAGRPERAKPALEREDRPQTVPVLEVAALVLVPEAPDDGGVEDLRRAGAGSEDLVLEHGAQLALPEPAAHRHPETVLAPVPDLLREQGPERPAE